MKGWRFWAIWSPLALLALVGLFHHELWLDEMHHWLLARDSASLSELAHNARFEAHPLLWNGLLWIITRFTSDPLYMQVLHGLLAMGVLALWVRYAPFPWYVLVLGGLGYFLLYEYAALSRNYVLGVLGLFMAASAIRIKPSGLGWITLGCLLAAHSHLLFLIPTVFLFAFAWIRHRQLWPKTQRFGYTIAFLLLLVPGLWWCIPHSEHTYLQLNESGLFSWTRIEAALHYLSESIVPVPDFAQSNWWNSHWLENRVDHSLGFAMIGLALFGLLIYTLRKDPLALGFFVVSVVAILVFAWLSEMRAVRYTGPIWISYLVAWWISKPLFRLDWPGSILLILLVIQMIAGALAWRAELQQPFSQGKAAAHYIRTNGLDELTIYSFPECAAMVTVGYLGTSACYPQTGICGSYCHWTDIPRDQDVQVFWENLQQEVAEEEGPVLLLLNRTLPMELAEQVETLRVFDNSQVNFGNVYLYRYRGS